MMPCARTAHAWLTPAPMAVAPDTPRTSTGTLELRVVPSPSRPREFEPQQRTVPCAESAHENCAPEATAVARGSSRTGAARIEPRLSYPRPSWPLTFRPQQTTVPSARSAQVWASPDAAAVTSDTPAMTTGLG